MLGVMMRTIALEQELSFQDALQAMLDGKCLGIRPDAGANTGFVEMYKPHWMNEKSPDFMLRWARSERDADIRTNQYLGTWKLVIADHRELTPNVELTGAAQLYRAASSDRRERG